jgi:phosphoribosylamine-glycine ligase
MTKIKKRIEKSKAKKTVVPANAVIMVVGSGGREHALVWKIAQSPLVRRIYCVPGNAGTAKVRKCRNVDIHADDMWCLLEFAKKKKPDLVVFGGETLLADGAADIFENAGFTVFGPSLEGAMMEASKEYAKDVIRSGKIKTAKYKVFTDSEKAKDYIREIQLDGVIKADGLTGGKGVSVYRSLAEAKEAINDMMVKRFTRIREKKSSWKSVCTGKKDPCFFLLTVKRRFSVRWLRTTNKFLMETVAQTPAVWVAIRRQMA